MLTAEQNYVLFLLRKSMGVSAETVEVPADTKLVTNYILKNGILLTVYQVLPEALQAMLQGRYYAAVRQYVNQEHEGEQVLQALSAEGLNCIGLKGWELRKLYPKVGMRQMADLDILVQPYHYSAIKSVMEELGYSGGYESSWMHDNFKKNNTLFEIHKRLTDDSSEIRIWEQGIWDRATIIEDHIYRMSPEVFYIFHFIHLHKDFMNGSLGLRRIADTWLLKHQGGVNMETVQKNLERFGIWKFHEKMVKLSGAVMGEEPMNEDAEFLLAHAFTHGIYGTGQSYKAGRIAAMGSSVRTGKIKSAAAAVFLPVSRMKAQFPVLEKYPVLLPYCWIKRINRFLKGDLKKSRAKLNYGEIGEEEFNEMKRFFEAGGVNG